MELVSGWIWGHSLRGFLELLSRCVFGVGRTDDEWLDRWYVCPLVGADVTVEVRLVRVVGGDGVSVTVAGPESSGLRLRVEVLVDACAPVRVFANRAGR
ncbi:hypothetical protein SRB5_70430 [Streptomyces sp. RB5]|uniref:Uncharacterized protein n=1 Tax=Streptomyces smaragdinus TaxID=2585196 RepID=A0A7K0CTQ9_9ACTN|nr:hypothetical protein [Streptomyces smaragdinus]